MGFNSGFKGLMVFTLYGK